MHAIHTDPLNYPSPAEFQPFRFTQKDARKPLVTLDDTFLTFGYSRTGCPGRWFGAHLMKVMIAFMVLNYDIEVIKEKRKMVEIMEFRFPREGEMVKFRRRVFGDITL